jgi:26S proteasome regulatory subunit T2
LKSKKHVPSPYKCRRPSLSFFSLAAQVELGEGKRGERGTSHPSAPPDRSLCGEFQAAAMGQGTPGGMGKQGGGDRKPGDGDKKDIKFEPPAAPSRVGRKQRKQKGAEAAAGLPNVAPLSKCRLRLLKLDRVKDYLLMEEEFVAAQERLRPQEDKAEEDRSKVDDLRCTPMSVGSLEEIIDESHAIVSSSVGPEYYVGILSFVDKDQLEPGCSILMHNKVRPPLDF